MRAAGSPLIRIIQNSRVFYWTGKELINYLIPLIHAFFPSIEKNIISESSLRPWCKCSNNTWGHRHQRLNHRRRRLWWRYVEVNPLLMQSVCLSWLGHKNHSKWHLGSPWRTFWFLLIKELHTKCSRKWEKHLPQEPKNVSIIFVTFKEIIQAFF